MAGGNREILSDHGVWGCGWGCADAVQQKDARQKMIFDPHLWDLSNTTGGREAGGGVCAECNLACARVGQQQEVEGGGQGGRGYRAPSDNRSIGQSHT